MACDDGARCTQGDVCRSDGECRGDALVCPPATACLDASACNPDSGVCAERTPRNEGGDLRRRQLLHRGRRLHPGHVRGPGQGLLPRATSASGPGVCDQASGLCTTGSFLDGAGCNDGNACTDNDSCSGGTCRGTPRSCPPMVCHAPGTCDPTTGACPAGAPLSGTECDDGDAVHDRLGLHGRGLRRHGPARTAATATPAPRTPAARAAACTPPSPAARPTPAPMAPSAPHLARDDEILVEITRAGAGGGRGRAAAGRCGRRAG